MPPRAVSVQVNEMSNLNGANDQEADEEPMSCADFCKGCGDGLKAKSGKDWGMMFLKIICLLASLYAFLFALDLMGGAFKVLGGCTAGGMFNGVTNPIAGLMIGVLATVLVQSSSTSTSITVSLVGAGQMSVRNAIPVIMGSNIGTSITNTIVSVGQIGDPDQFEKSFAGATVHDMFNFLTVAVLLPIELITRMLERMTGAMAPQEVAEGDKWVGPLKVIVSPLVKLLLAADKKVISKVALQETTCTAIYDAVEALPDKASTDCNDWKYGLIKCSCDDETGIASCPAFYTYKGTYETDMAAGGVSLFVSLIILVVALLVMVKLLQSMVLGTSSRMLRKATQVHPVFAIIIGICVTILVQSSSVTTSVLTPLVGVGVIPLERMLPLTIGANIGTTATALLASLVSTKTESVQIALCHLFFNIIGTLIWYPIPVMRRLPLNAARGLGAMTRRSKLTPLLYILFAFVLIPGVFLGISFLIGAEGALRGLGVILLVFVLCGLGYSILWWVKLGGRAKLFGYLESKQAQSDEVSKLPLTVARLENKIRDLEEQLSKEPKINISQQPVDAKA